MERVKLILQTILVYSLTWRDCSSNQVIYELQENRLCTGTGVHGSQVSMLCEISNLSELCANPNTVQLKWVFTSPVYRRLITDSDKYSIWEEDGSDRKSSVLRINAVDQDEDPGMYTCNIHCDSTSNPALSYKLEMCVQDAATKLISCSLSTEEDSCVHTFGDGKCDEKCDSESELYDGDDCDSYSEDTCAADCLSTYSNGKCETGCSGAQCGFDGGDCPPSAQSVHRESIAVVVPANYTDDQIRLLSMQLSTTLSTLVKQHGRATPWTATNNQGIQKIYLSPSVFQEAGNQLILLHYTLVPQTCGSSKCFFRARNAAKYISHHLTKNNKFKNNTVAVIGISSSLDDCPQSKPRDLDPSYTGSSPKLEFSNKKTTLKTDKSTKLGVGEIAGISMCGLAIVLLIIGIVVACRYRKIALTRSKSQSINKESQIKEYIESIPTDLSSDGNSSAGGAKSPQSSTARSIVLRDPNMPSNVTNIDKYSFEEDV